MRNPHKISRRSEVIRGVFGHFVKNAKDMRLLAIFQQKWLSMGCSDWAEILRNIPSKFCAICTRVLGDALELGQVVGVSCTFVGHLARFGTVGGDLSGT